MQNIAYILFLAFIACRQAEPSSEVLPPAASTLSTRDSFPAYADDPAIDSTIKRTIGDIDARNVRPEAIVAYAQTLTGVPYKFGSTDPAQGFDCSGFITHVFNHFNIQVPRSSVDFTNVGREVNTSDALPGDLILFTGTDSTIRIVGHMGIVTEADKRGGLSFIHSTSGKAYGVTTTPLNSYYMGRFVKVIRVF